MNNSKVKMLVLDIETSPIISYTWGIFDQNVALNQVKQDWNLLSYAAKWTTEKKVIYDDQRRARDVHNDKELLKGLWGLLNEADVVITQNGIKFDIKKINARFAIHQMKPPSGFRSIDTLVLAKKRFGFTSNKLEYLSDKLCTKYKKLKHKKFPGFELWLECLKGNVTAWDEMKKYNIHDVLATEELYQKLQPWGIGVNTSAQALVDTCACGGTKFSRNGFALTNFGKFQRYECNKCGAEYRDGINLAKVMPAQLRAIK